MILRAALLTVFLSVSVYEVCPYRTCTKRSSYRPPLVLLAAGPRSNAIVTESSGTMSAAERVVKARDYAEVLEVAGQLTLPGEERRHFETQHVHMKRRQHTATNALRRLAKFLVGQRHADTRMQVASTQAFRDLCVCALHKLQDMRADDVDSYCDAIRCMGHFPSDAAHSELMSRLLDEVLPDIVERGHVTALTGVEVALRRLNARAAHARLAAQAVARHSLPFRLLSGAVRGVASFSDIRAEVAFSQDTFTTLDGKAVLERRETCWMAEAGIGGLAYSGKIMAPVPLSPAVVRLRDSIEASTGVRFDCCLVNLYADGDCACKFHSDPDHGRVWARDTVVVSIGETRRFVLREITPEAVSVSVTKEQRHHSFHVCDGDAFHMFGACQDDFQHAVLKAEGPDNCGPRASVVFKRALPLANGKKGHGVAKPAAVSVKIVSKGDSVQRGQAHEVKSSKSKRR